MRTAFFAGVLVGATEVSKKSQAFASRNTGRFRSLDVLYLFVPMTFLRDGSSYDPWRIVQATDRWMGLREKVENWRREVNTIDGTNPIIYKIVNMRGGVKFLPSTI